MAYPYYDDPEQQALASYLMAQAQPGQMSMTGREAGTMAGSMVPGAGLMDALGIYPAGDQGFSPSVRQNLGKGEYLDAMLQLLGAGGDLAMATGVGIPVGMTMKTAAATGKGAKAASKAGKASKTAKEVTDSAAGYIPYTKTDPSPDPRIGTRFNAQQIPGLLAPRQDINFDDMLGASIMTYPTDRLSRHVKIDNVSGVPLDRPIITPGGLTYASDLENIKNNTGYASNEAAARSQNNRALQARKENLAQGGTGRIFMAPHIMAMGGENFSTAPTDGLLSLIETIGMNPKLAALISDRVRTASVPTGKVSIPNKYKDFVGIGDGSLRDQLMTGAGLDVGSAGDLRKVFVNKMSSAAAEQGLGFNYKDLQMAMMDPNVANKQTGLMGDTIYEAFPEMGISAGNHPAYGFNMPGRFSGNSVGAPVSQVMEPLYNRLRLNEMGKMADPDRLTTGKLSTAGKGISLLLDEKEIARLKRLFGQ